MKTYGEFPGRDGKPFKVFFDRNDIFPQNTVIQYSNQQFFVTKVYEATWWRKLLMFFGFKVKLFECKYYEETKT